MTDRTHPPFKSDDALHDAHLDALWAATRTEGPSAEIDAALHAAARRAVSAGPLRAEAVAVAEATRPERWWTPLAAAAAIGAIALGLLQLLPDERSERAVVSDMPAGSERKLKASDAKTMAEPSVSQPAATAGNALRAPAMSAAKPDAEAPAPATPAPAAPAPAAPAALPVPAPAKSLPAPPASAEQRAASSTVAAPPVVAPEASPEPSRARNVAPLPFPLEATPQRTAAPPPDFAARDKDALARTPAYRRDEGMAESGQVAPSLPDAVRAPGAAARPQGEASATSAAAARAQRETTSPGPPAAAAPAPLAAPAAAGAPAPASPPASAGGVGGTTSMAKTMKKQESDDAAKSNVRPVDEWIVLIRRLREERNFDEVAKELAAFRTAYPDADRLLPPDLRDWRPPPGYRR